jgi:hypothetical protein
MRGWVCSIPSYNILVSTYEVSHILRLVTSDIPCFLHYDTACMCDLRTGVMKSIMVEHVAHPRLTTNNGIMLHYCSYQMTI